MPSWAAASGSSLGAGLSAPAPVLAKSAKASAAHTGLGRNRDNERPGMGLPCGAFEVGRERKLITTRRGHRDSRRSRSSGRPRLPITHVNPTRARHLLLLLEKGRI